MFALFSLQLLAAGKKGITYKDLPLDVRNKFENVYHYKTLPVVNAEGDTVDWYSPPLAECYNLKKIVNAM